MQLVLSTNTHLLRRIGSRLGIISIWLGILPFFLLCWYAHPSADDFLTANDINKHGHVGYLKYMYLHWAGRYTAIASWSFLNPVSFGHIKQGYGPVCFLLLALLLASIALLIRALLQGSKLTAWQLWHIGASALLLITYNLPSTAECFYWLTSGFNYLLPGILVLLALATLATSTIKQYPIRRHYLIATGVLLFLAVGCNETIAVPVLLTAWGFAAMETWRRQRAVGITIALAVSTGCALAFLAPGNAARMAVEGSAQPGLLPAGLGIIKFTAYCLVIWLGNGILIVVTLLLIPVFARLARLTALPINHLVRYPILLTLLIPGFLAAGLLPSFWVRGVLSPPRALNLLYICLIVNWFLAVYAWAFYFVQANPNAALLRVPNFVRWALLAWLPFTFLNDYNHHLIPDYRLSTNNSFLAYRDLLSGSAARYDSQLSARYQYLLTNTLARPKVKALVDPPFTLLFSDITPDAKDWSNLAYADFFKKESIITQVDTVGQ